MSRAPDLLRGPVSMIREQYGAVAGQSERTILLGTILLASVVSGATGFVLTQYYSVDVPSSLLTPYADCIDSGVKIGRHCFSDYTLEVIFGRSSVP